MVDEQSPPGRIHPHPTYQRATRAFLASISLPRVACYREKKKADLMHKHIRVQSSP